VAKFYFDLVGDKAIFDNRGVNLKNIDAARAHAVTFARELMATRPELFREAWSTCSVQICNGNMERMFTIPFTELHPAEKK
jgi:hypothetical protein